MQKNQDEERKQEERYARACKKQKGTLSIFTLCCTELIRGTVNVEGQTEIRVLARGLCKDVTYQVSNAVATCSLKVSLPLPSCPSARHFGPG